LHVLASRASKRALLIAVPASTLYVYQRRRNEAGTARRSIIQPSAALPPGDEEFHRVIRLALDAAGRTDGSFLSVTGDRIERCQAIDI